MCLKLDIQVCGQPVIPPPPLLSPPVLTLFSVRNNIKITHIHTCTNLLYTIYQRLFVLSCHSNARPGTRMSKTNEVHFLLPAISLYIIPTRDSENNTKWDAAPRKPKATKLGFVICSLSCSGNANSGQGYRVPSGRLVNTSTLPPSLHPTTHTTRIQPMVDERPVTRQQ
jgi:hypothetical protein